MLRDTRIVTDGSAASVCHVDPASGDIYYQDPTRSKNLGVATIQVEAGRRNRNVTNSFLSNEGDVPTNLNGFTLPWDATLIGISMSCNLNTQTWTAEVRVNGGGVGLDTLTIINQFSNQSTNNDTDLNAGDRVMIYCNGTSIDYPHVTLFFRRRF